MAQAYQYISAYPKALRYLPVAFLGAKLGIVIKSQAESVGQYSISLPQAAYTLILAWTKDSSFFCAAPTARRLVSGVFVKLRVFLES